MVRDSDCTVGDERLIKDVENLRVSSVEPEEEFEDYEEDECEEPVVLGFVQSPEHEWSLLRHLFPSKAGGLPAWLDPVDLPSGKSCTCDVCGTPLRFLLQVYAPLSHKESAFHRTLYIFICTSMTCLIQHQRNQQNQCSKKGSRSVKVFRCQLPRTNPYYSPDAPKNDGTDKPSTVGAALCDWCGSWKGDRVCSSCGITHYCSDIHQVP
uniref:Programmed cell death protein 2 n=1 Tax=Kalanchoe fedtschenkoi TaxID=63787 RepID=A0A7N1A1N2_KALFE